MKFLLLSLVSGLAFVACNNNTNVPTQNVAEESDSGIYYPYSAIYSNGFKTGSYKNLKTVTEIWREYENGDITKTASNFADSLTVVYPDKVLNGTTDSVLREIKRIRDSYLTVQCFIYSWMPARAKDNNDDWVFIWGRQEFTDKAGKLKIAEVHEIWQFDKKGKITLMQQYQTRVSSFAPKDFLKKP
jgi:hypothetical protein